MTDSPPLVGGRYALLRQLAVGGMAEVWLALQTGSSARALNAG